MTLRTSALSTGALALAALVLSPASARADEPSSATSESRIADDELKPALALGIGGAITFLSLGVGAAILANTTNSEGRNAALLGAQSGMVFAPLAAHAVVGETMRGVWFSLPLVVPVGVNGLMAGLYPTLIKRAPAGIQYTTFISTTVSIVGSILGVLDAVRVGERKSKKNVATASPALTVVPMFGDGTAGALLTGSL